MQPIQMVDTKRQYLKIREEIDRAVLGVIDSSVFIGGKAVSDFAAALAAYNEVKHVIPCANGTDALQIAMMALDLQPGDEVITPSFTYIATVEVMALLKLKPVFVEVDKRTFCIDPQAIEKAITPRTKAIVPVHLYGQSCDMQPIMDIANRHGLHVIEDNAQAIGATYRFADGSVKKTGSIGTIGCTSFYPSKNLGCFGDGGAIGTNDEKLAGKMRMISNHGQTRRYYHDIVGCNSRLDAIQAAILNIKLRHLDQYTEARTRAADFYNQAFAGIKQITTPYRSPNGRHVFHQYTVVLEDASRDALNEYLAAANIPSMIYYPVPAHKQKMFDQFGGSSFQLPVTDWLTERVISLPMHSEMDEDQLIYITEKVKAFINQ